MGNKFSSPQNIDMGLLVQDWGKYRTAYKALERRKTMYRRAND